MQSPGEVNAWPTEKLAHQKVEVPVEVTDTIRTAVAAHPGANSNLLADDTLMDALSGTSVLNGIPVEVEPARSRT